MNAENFGSRQEGEPPITPQVERENLAKEVEPNFKVVKPIGYLFGLGKVNLIVEDQATGYRTRFSVYSNYTKPEFTSPKPKTQDEEDRYRFDEGRMGYSFLDEDPNLPNPPFMSSENLPKFAEDLVRLLREKGYPDESE